MTPRATFSPILPKPAPTASAAHRIRQKPNKTAMTMPILVLFIIGKPPVLRLESSDTAVIIAVPRTIVRLVPSQLLLGNKSTRSVLPFKLRLRSFSWNRTIRPDAERLCCRARSAVAFARAPVLHLLCLHLWCANRNAKNIVRLVPSQPSLGNKSTRSVLPFKLRLRSFSWNRTIVPQFAPVAYIKNERY